MSNKAFTLVELIFVIVIIGVLSAAAIPQFSKLTDNAKISAELSTASAVQTAIEACHGEWIISDCDFTCGASITKSDLDANNGYPSDLGDSLEKILKNATTSEWTRSGTQYRGPASGSKGTSHCKTGKPCIGKYWDYNTTAGTFTLI